MNRLGKMDKTATTELLGRKLHSLIRLVTRQLDEEIED